MAENRVTAENYLDLFRERWGDLYDYSKSGYTDSKTPITIICHEHGEFQLRARDHYNGYKCPECEYREIRGRQSLQKHLLDGMVYSSEIPISFVAVDFELLANDFLSACSIGLVKFVDGKIADRMHSLIQPPLDKIEGKASVPVGTNGGITKEDVKNAPTMAELMPSIEEFVGKLPLVAHNCTMERNCFQSTIEYWRIKTNLDFQRFLDTQYLSEDIEKIFGKTFKGEGSHTLTTVCYRLGLPILDHHHADQDAEMCGNVLLRLAKIQRGEMIPIFKEGLPPNEKGSRKKHYEIKRYDDSIVATVDINQVPNNPFKGKIIVLTCFKTEYHDRYKQKLLNLGAQVPKDVSKKTDILIFGQEPGHLKKEKAEKYGIQKMSEEEFLLILHAYE